MIVYSGLLKVYDIHKGAIKINKQIYTHMELVYSFLYLDTQRIN